MSLTTTATTINVELTERPKRRVTVCVMCIYCMCMCANTVKAGPRGQPALSELSLRMYSGE